MRLVLSLSFIVVMCMAIHAHKPQIPTEPTNVICTYSPAFGDVTTVRAAWSDPKKWNDSGNAAGRSFLATCRSAEDGVFYSQIVSATTYLVQFEVPAVNRRYTFTVYATNDAGNTGHGGSYVVSVP